MTSRAAAGLAAKQLMPRGGYPMVSHSRGAVSVKNGTLELEH